MSLEEGRIEPLHEEAEHLREAIQQMTREARKALAWVCVSLIAVIYLVLLLPEYPTWTLLFLATLGVFLFWNWGDWRSSTKKLQETKARLDRLEKQIKEREVSSP